MKGMLKGITYNQKYDGLDVQIQDQTSDIVNYFMRRLIRPLIVTTAQIDGYTITVTDATGVVQNNSICVQEGSRAFQAKILNIDGNILTLDTPLDYTFTSDASLYECSFDMNVDGSTTPVKFSLNPIAGNKFDVYTVCIAFTDDSDMDDARFAGITGLTKGIVLRKADDIHHTIFNAKNNGKLKQISGNTMPYSDKAPSGSYGFNITYDIREKHGVAIRLDGNLNERLEIIIQDNLTGISSFRVLVQGHFVED